MSADTRSINNTASLLMRAKQSCANFQSAICAFYQKRDLVLLSFWILGRDLAALKASISHGNWRLCVVQNFPALGKAEATRINNAKRCIKFWKENQSERLRDLTNGDGKSSRIPNDLVSLFSNDSVRKFMFGHVPAKDRPQLEGDEKVSAPQHYLGFVNDFSKWDRQVRIGLIAKPDIDDMRFQCRPVIRRLVELLGRDWFQGVVSSCVADEP